MTFRLKRSTLRLHLKHSPLTFCCASSPLCSKVKNKKLYLATFASVLGPMSFGFVLGYSSPAIPELTSIDDPRLRLDGDQASWFGVWRCVFKGPPSSPLLNHWVLAVGWTWCFVAPCTHLEGERPKTSWKAQPNCGLSLSCALQQNHRKSVRFVSYQQFLMSPHVANDACPWRDLGLKTCWICALETQNAFLHGLMQ